MEGTKMQRARQAKKVWSRLFLREWREYRGLSLEKLAEEADVSPALVSLIENRKSAGSPDSFKKLAKALQSRDR
jgi:transcriptional regulator with XRE-family HTH domain